MRITAQKWTLHKYYKLSSPHRCSFCLLSANFLDQMFNMNVLVSTKD
jgi:hypothetical protein